MNKPAIPGVPRIGEDRVRFDTAIKETLEIIAARRSDKIRALESTATTAEIVAKISEILTRLQG